MRQKNIINIGLNTAQFINIEKLKVHLVNYPNDIEGWNNLGMALVEKERFNEAEDAFQKIIELDPESSTGHINRGMVFLNWGISENSRSILERAITANEIAVNKAPHIPYAYYNLGTTLFQLSQLTSDKIMLRNGINFLQTAIEVDPCYEMAYNNFAIAVTELINRWSENDSFGDAINALDRLIELRGSSTDLQVKKANLFFSYAKATGSIPDFINASLWFENAIANGEDASLVFFHNEYCKFHSSLAKHLYEDCFDIINTMQRYCLSEHGKAAWFGMLGDLMFKFGCDIRSKELVIKAIEAYDQHTLADPSGYKVGLGEILCYNYLAQQFGDAKYAYKAISKIDLSKGYQEELLSEYHGILGTCYTIIGRREANNDLLEVALGHLKKAIKHYNSNDLIDLDLFLSIYLSLTSCYIELAGIDNSIHYYREAIKESDHALQKAPFNANLKANKAIALANLGKITKNLIDIKSALNIYEELIVNGEADATLWTNKGVALQNFADLESDQISFTQALECYDLAIKADKMYINVYIAKAIALGDEEFNDPLNYTAIRQNIRRSVYLLQGWPEYPIFIYRSFRGTDNPLFLRKLYNAYPFLGTGSDFSMEIEENEKICVRFRNRLVSVFKEIVEISNTVDSRNRLFYTYKALSDHIGGDRISSFDIQDTILDTPDNQGDLRHHYYLIINAQEILHPDMYSLKEFACNEADKVLKLETSDPDQLYYAGCIYIFAEMAEKSYIALSAAFRMGFTKASFKLLESYHFFNDTTNANKIADVILQNEHWRDFGSRPTMMSAIEEIEWELTEIETYYGWYLAGLYADSEHEKLNSLNVPITRSVYYDKMLDTPIWPEPTQFELNEIEPEKLTSLINTCRTRMPKLFSEYSSKNSIVPELFSEHLFSEMLDEKEHVGYVDYNDYSEFTALMYRKGSLSFIDFYLIITYLNLKARVINKGFQKNAANIVANQVVGNVVTAVCDALGGVTGGLPVKLLLKLVFDHSEEERIKSINFINFKKHYNKVKAYTPDEIADLLDGNEWLDAASDILGGSN